MTAAAPALRSLQALARHYGVQTSYVDLAERRRAASPDALVAVLQSLGAPLDSIAGAPDALRAAQRDANARTLAPVVVAAPGDSIGLPLQTPRDAARVRVHVRFEDGRSKSVLAPIAEGRARIRGPWPIGYHRIRVERGRATHSAHVLIAPRQCYRAATGNNGRRWGVFLPLYALRTRGDSGAGDFSGLRGLLDWAGGLGAAVAGTLPLLPQFLDDPCDPSPYSPVSRLFWNEFFIDPEDSPEWLLSIAARQIAERSRPVVSRSRRSRLIDYRTLMRAKRGVLEALAAECFARPARRAELDRFLKERPEAADYARFRAACERHGVPWKNWPERLRSGNLRSGDYDDAAFRYHVYVQWIAEHQIRRAADRGSGADRGLYLDLPLGVNPAGYDTWRERDAFLSGLSAGAPPDPFFTRGQKWGLPPMNPHGLRRHGYSHWAACLRHHLRHAALLRIDHIMGFHRVFCVPQSMDAADGVYVQYPADEFYAVLAIESHRAQCAVAGEDLGTVPDRVRRSMRRRGIDRLYVMQFSFDGKRVATPPADSVASLNTHDMAPFAGFYRGADIGYRVDLGLMTRREAQAEARGRAGMRTALTAFLKQEGLLRRGAKTAGARDAMQALLRFLAKSPAAMLLVNLEDLWLEEEQQNTPGTTSERKNWQRRAAKSFEEFSADPAILNLLREIDEMRRQRMPK